MLGELEMNVPTRSAQLLAAMQASPVTEGQGVVLCIISLGRTQKPMWGPIMAAVLPCMWPVGPPSVI